MCYGCCVLCEWMNGRRVWWAVTKRSVWPTCAGRGKDQVIWKETPLRTGTTASQSTCYKQWNKKKKKVMIRSWQLQGEVSFISYFWKVQLQGTGAPSGLWVLRVPSGVRQITSFGPYLAARCVYQTWLVECLASGMHHDTYESHWSENGSLLFEELCCSWWSFQTLAF